MIIQSYSPGGANSTRMGESCVALPHISGFIVTALAFNFCVIVSFCLYKCFLGVPTSLCLVTDSTEFVIKFALHIDDLLLLELRVAVIVCKSV